MNNLTAAFSSLSVSDQMKLDFDSINNQKNEVIAAFLGIGKKDGWNQTEGNSYQVGFQFTRYMFKKFCIESQDRLIDYAEILTAANQGFSNLSSPARAAADPTIEGWVQHAVSRVIGFLGTRPNSNGPFIEVLINSARSGNNPYGYPFHTSVLLNREAAISRWELLKSMKDKPESIASPIFYQHNSADRIDQFKIKFKQEHKKDLGPNATHLLDGLKLLEITKMKTQTIGNCWMKQTKRQVLVLLFIEILTHRKELTPAEAMKLAKSLYKKWKAFTREEIKETLLTSGINLDLLKIVKGKLGLDSVDPK